MASKTIGTILTLKDRMSPKLFKVSSSVKTMSKDMQRASKQAENMANKFTSSVNKMVGKAVKFAAIGAAAIATTGGAALIKQSDAYASIQARLKLINDGQQTVDEFNKKIFDSADRARGNYQDMADIIGKLGITAGDAFKSNDEILQFSELMSKSFKVGGASAQEQSAAMYQLTQAMASGKLQGDEFRSISENAPMLAKAIADEMGVSMGQLKEMSSDGKITSDVIKSALLNSSDAINAQFAEMPLTFAEATTKIKNTITQKLAPAFEKLSGWLNSDEGKAAFDKVGDAIALAAEKVPALIDGVKLVFEGAKRLFEFIKKHQDVIIFIGTFVVALSGLIKIMSVLKAAFGAVSVVVSIFSGALAISPIGWVIAAIAALIAVGVLLCKNWDTVKRFAGDLWGNVKTAFGGIGDAISGAFDRAKNAVKGVFDWFGEKLSWLDKKVESIPLLGSLYKGGKALVGGTIGAVGQMLSGTGASSGTASGYLGGNALGTSYWRGGLTRVNERGGEIVDLPSGTQIIPHDISKRATGGQSVKVYVTVQGNVIGNRQYADELGGVVARRVLNAMANT